MTDPITRLNAALEGRYRIERELGEGGMATIYLADDLKHERQVALKVLKPELAAVVGAERFLTEIKTTANLQHPHILPLFDSGEADNFLFYVMPYVEGESLRERLDRDHQLPVNEAIEIATKVARALQAAHERGVIHRDIKPANILLARGEPLVSDFGIALAVSQGRGGRLTETGLSLGTPHYMSPEQATGDQNIGPATDLYSLGCVLYEMLVGEPPYTGSTPQAVLGKIVVGDVPSARAGRSSVPLNVDSAIRRALEKVPADRFREPQELERALADAEFQLDAGTAAARTVLHFDSIERVEVLRPPTRDFASMLLFEAILLPLAGVVGLVVGLSLGPATEPYRIWPWEIIEPDTLIAALHKHATPAREQIWNSLDRDTREAIEAFDGVPDEDPIRLRAVRLARQALNTLIQSEEPIFDTELVADGLQSLAVSAEGVGRTNRALVEASFPGSLQRYVGQPRLRVLLPRALGITWLEFRSLFYVWVPLGLVLVIWAADRVSLKTLKIHLKDMRDVDRLLSYYIRDLGFSPSETREGESVFRANVWTWLRYSVLKIRVRTFENGMILTGPAPLMRRLRKRMLLLGEGAQ